MRVVASNTFNVDWPALSSSDPIRWRPRADPVQKHDPGEMDPRKWKRGIDKPRPVTEARIERSEMRDRNPRISLRSIRATRGAFAGHDVGEREKSPQKNAWMPVCARPRMSAWMSCVPSYVFTVSR